MDFVILNEGVISWPGLTKAIQLSIRRSLTLKANYLFKIKTEVRRRKSEDWGLKIRILV